MAHYLITGGAGFIGRHLCNELTSAGHRVRILDSLTEHAHDEDPEPGLSADEFLHGDVRDPETVEQALDGVNGVFHLAAEVGVGQSMYDIERYVSANDLGTAVLMQRLVESNVRRIVVASSMSIYGEGLYRRLDGGAVESARRTPAALHDRQWDPVDQDGAALQPVATPEERNPDLFSVYALTKFNQEKLTLMLSAAYGIEAVALRLFNVFGPGQMLSSPYTGVLAIFAARLLGGEAPTIFEDGRQLRDFVHVRDVARAFRLAMEQPDVSGEVFNIGSGRGTAIEAVARLLAEATGRPDLSPVTLGKARVGDARHCFGDIAKARARLGFEPRNRLEDSLDEFVDWVTAQRSLDQARRAPGGAHLRGLVA